MVLDPRFIIEPEFVLRCNEMFKEEGDALYEKRKKSINKWNENNREKLRESQKNYNKTEKGKTACRRRVAVYHRRVREMSKLLSEDELEEIKLFYVNCPSGYQVDHIIPIAKGGQHIISNLQYLTAKENRTKKDRLDWKPTPAKP